MAAPSENIFRLQDFLQRLLNFKSNYQRLLDACILEYFTCKHWQEIPLSWQDVLENMTSEDLADWLDSKYKYKCVWPLSLMSFKASTAAMSLPRKAVTIEQLTTLLNGVIPSFSNASVRPKIRSDIAKLAMKKHIKAKKRHEIQRLTEVVDLLIATCLNKNCDRIVDVGSGQGHLARVINFSCGIRTSCVELNQQHVSRAKLIDDSVSEELSKMHLSSGNSPVHTVCMINCCDTDKIKVPKVLNLQPEESFGLIGLHTCGSLSCSLVTCFAAARNCGALISVSCCYMKLCEEKNCSNNYPMSDFVRSQSNSSLSYEALEIACHAIEMYSKKLWIDPSSLKIHCYRALLEVFITRSNPLLKRCGLSGVRRANQMTFENYAKEALRKRPDIVLDLDELRKESGYTEKCLSESNKVLVFHTLRLLMARVVETIVLVDRLLYLIENGCDSCWLVPLFDPEISPRNHVLLAIRSQDDDKN